MVTNGQMRDSEAKFTPLLFVFVQGGIIQMGQPFPRCDGEIRWGCR